MNVIKETQSICPECLKILKATIFEENNKVWIKKECSEHGEFLDLYWGDYEMYKKAMTFYHDGKGIQNPNVELKNPCPMNCGLCKMHTSHTALGNVVVTNRCDLQCFYCFFYAKAMGYVYEPSLDQIRMMLRKMKEEKPVSCNAVQLSLHPQEKIFVKSPSGIVYSIEIGKFIDNLMKNKKPSIFSTPIVHERLNIKGWEVLSIDEKLKCSFRPIESVIRHKNNGELFEIETIYGWKITTTGSHSIFVLNNDGNIVPKKVSELKCNDILIGCLNIPQLDPIREINLVDLILKFGYDYVDKIRVCNLSKKEKKIYDKTFRRRFINSDSVPLREYLKVKIGKFIRYFNSRKEKKLPIILKITPELCRLLGYYVGKGCTYKNGVVFSFGLKEKKVINDFKFCLKKIFCNASYRERVDKLKNEVQIYIEGYLYKLFFSRLMKANKDSLSKEIPWIIFNVSNDLKKEFLKAYFNCDGNVKMRKSGYEINHNTSSRNLASDLVLLHLQLGIIPRIEFGKSSKSHIEKTGQLILKSSNKYRIVIGGKEQLSKALWYVNGSEAKKFKYYIFSKEKHSPLYSRILITQQLLDLSINKVENMQIKHLLERIKQDKSISKENLMIITDYFNKTGIPFDSNLNEISHSNIGFFKIRKIRKVKSKTKYVYDLSVPNSQAFFAGLGQLLAHNTGGEPLLRDDIIDIIKIAKEEDYDHVQLNTNGIRLSQSLEFTKKIKEAGVNTIYLSFDGTTPKTNPKNHWEIPKILENCRKANIGIVLVPTVINTVNDHDVGNILKFGIKNMDVVRGVNYQPVSLVGRITKADVKKFRITIPDVIKKIEEQTNGMVSKEDWYPVPTVTPITHYFEALTNMPKYELTAHPACGMATYLFLDGEKVIPLPKFFNVEGFLKFLEELAEQARGYKKIYTTLKIITKLNSFIDKKKQPKGLKISRILFNILRYGDYNALGKLHHKSLFVGMMHFMDLWNYDIERVKKCCIHYAQPDGRIVPFCAFNVIPQWYRDEIQEKYSLSLEDWEKKFNKKINSDLYQRNMKELENDPIYKKTYEGFI
ncbi:MAG: radical SAM protein [Candidatus Aenigmatarchaeota archaeon]